MDQLINQTKFKFSGRSGADESSSKGKRIPPQKSVSFKPDTENTEKMRSPSWLRRQFSGQNNVEHDSNGIEQATAVAAAVIAVASMEDSSIPETKMPSKFVKPTFSRKISLTGSRKVPTSDSGEASKKSKDNKDKVVPDEITPASDDEKPAKIAHPASQIERNPSFVDTEKTPKNLTRTTTKKDEKTRQQTAKPETGLAIADEWEKQQLGKIKERHEQSKETVLAWENKKKAKARSRLDKREKELETKRLTVLKEYSGEIENIYQVAERARAKAAEKLRNDELKEKKKANKIIKTGKVPRGCFCF